MAMDRRFTVVSPLGEDVLRLKSMNGHEALGRPFRYELELLAEQAEVDVDKLIGAPMTIEVRLPDEGLRRFCGLVTSFGEAGGFGRYARFHAVLEPWFAVLEFSTDCRIFQALPVPEIAKSVFRDHGFSDFEERLYETYREWEYMVQYRESAFAFISRLMEQEGIYYHFRHEDDRHFLVLSDSSSSHDPAGGYEEIPYYPPGQTRREHECVTSFHRVRQMQSGAVALTDFDFKRPKVSLMAEVSDPGSYAHASFEVYDFPGEYEVAAVGQDLAKRRLEERQAAYERFEGTGDVAGVGVGQLFKLTNHPLEGHNKEYLVVESQYTLVVNGYESADQGLDESFHWSFSAIDSRRPFRTPVRTKKPLIRGPQTAVVVGPGGEEVWVDEFGRIKVQFHWDRVGQKNENSSCWVRVSQAWAGAGFGVVTLPRIGQEVVVEFLEGDPDRPLVTGRVYNADNMPPYKLPDNKTQSGIKSRSSKGGAADNCNEIRLEDKKGSELFFVQAEKDLETLAKHDEQRTTRNNRTKTVGNDETVSIGANRSATVGKSETLTVGENQSESIGGDQSTSIGANHTVTVGAGQAVMVAAVQSVAVGGAQSLDVGAEQSVSIGGAQSLDVGMNRSLSVGGAHTVTVGKDENVTIEGKQAIKVMKDGTLDIGKKMALTVGDELTIKVGKASITLKKDGSITIDGKDVKLKASGKIDLNASSDVKIKGSKVGQN